VKVPLTWLREYVPFSASPAELAERLTLSSAEVERIAWRGVPDQDGNLGLYRVGRVLEADKHPNADRLQLCRVDVGEGDARQIVCGAWNFSAGATVAVALPGAVLRDGRTLERAQLRGTVSDGMILSEHELELGTDHTGILVLPEPLEPGTPLAEVIPLGEPVLELEVFPNRPDLLSVYGMAREVAALYETELASPPGEDPGLSGNETPDIQIEDLEGCPRYIGRLFRNVRIGPSPPWLKARLVGGGMRPISNIVDVTNYVMLALGNPLHAFDADKIGGGRIVVRRARKGEELRTLDGTLRRLDASDLVIADAERPIAFAGVMGGLESEVGQEATSILLEAANFEPVRILKTSERHALRTEGSNRWEKGVDPHLAPQAAALATELIVSLTGGEWVGDVDVKGKLPESPVARLRSERTSKLLGLEVPAETQRGILERLGFAVEDDWSVTVPTWRARDVTREIDLVEEIARIHGLEKVPFTLPLRSAMFGRLTKPQRLRRLVEDTLAGVGFAEAYTSALVRDDPHPEAIRLPDPLTADQAVLRTTLLGGLVDAARRNAEHGNEGIALFEVARVYLPPAPEPRTGSPSVPSGEVLPEERLRAAGITEGGYFRAKGAVEVLHAALGVEPRFERAHEPFLHPGKAARVGAGWVGELHPETLEGSWGAFELDLEALFAAVPERAVYDDVITFPAVHQDLAFVVAEDVPAGDLVAAAREAAGPELREGKVFDEYRGGQIPAGKKSIAFRVSFQSPERTLSDDDARALRDRIAAALSERFGAELRA
jgi:phenylalanyl-tRNA synthetase beta chain